jgi:hypothetical protein
MCGGMKIVDMSKILDQDELTILIGMVTKEIDNRFYNLRVVNVTNGDEELARSIVRLEVVLDKLENIRSG